MFRHNMTYFNHQLIFCIESGNNDMAKSLIQRDINFIKNNIGPLLHYAVLFDNDTIVKYLLELGCDIDVLDHDSQTPLMSAVKMDSMSVIKLLLDANASIECKNARGKSIVELIFSSQPVFADVTKLFVQRLQRDSGTAENLVDRLLNIKSSMYHATFSEDTKVMKGLLERGVHVNSADYFNRTGLHAAVKLNNLNLVKWLLDNNINVNALDGSGNSPLYYAAINGQVDMVRILLENAANPNTTNKRFNHTPLYVTYANSLDKDDQTKFDLCAELLLQYGAIPRNSSVNSNTLFDYALFAKSSTRINLLIAYLAILDKLGKSVTKSVMRCNVAEHSAIQPQLEHNYEMSLKLLGWNVYRESTLFDVLMESIDQLRVRVRNREFVTIMNYVHTKAGQMYPFYFEPLMKRISKAADIVKLEDKAILILCQLFHGNYNECYIFAKKVVGYLNEKDLERVCQVSDL